ncbi:MAG: hypothetical protein ACOVQA_07185 [Thermoflexibacteraceae bacterium]|jgi:hypothetical protein
MTIIFDEKGFLQPPKTIALTPEEFETIFVDNTKSAQRQRLAPILERQN